MRLSRIKIAGFKSFVDPTVLVVPGNRLGVVGPNGCGKSNTIDAVRWVMGESSARHLRGDSSDDVIFSGSASRKPVGQASVELIFDNSAGRLGGEYAAFGEISVRRILTRDGQSRYFLNGTRARRKDITDLFLGTGLGPRSYAIIEQGMISRLIEARPEELRVYLEEAAGISRYRERRRETENRVRHTRENLERLQDLRDEVDRQAARLARQAAAAEKYKEWSALRRRRQAERSCLQWQAAHAQWQAEHAAQIAAETRLLALQTRCLEQETALEAERQSRVDWEARTTAAQSDFYQVSGKVSALEQSIRHAEVELRREEQEMVHLAERVATGSREIEEGLLSRSALEEEILLAEAAWEEADQVARAQDDALEQVEKRRNQVRQERDAGEQVALNWQRQAEMSKAGMDHAEQSLRRLQQRFLRLQEEEDRLQLAGSEDALEILHREVEAATEHLLGLEEQLQTQQVAGDHARLAVEEVTADLHAVEQEAREIAGRLATLEILPDPVDQAADEQQLQDWLHSLGLDGAARITDELQVEPGWEKAVETVLGAWLEAIVAPLEPLLEYRRGLPFRALTDFRPAVDAVPSADTLAAKVLAPLQVRDLLMGIYCAESLPEARARLPELEDRDSIVTREGVWLSPHRVQDGVAERRLAGVVERQRMQREWREQLDQIADRQCTLEQERESRQRHWQDGTRAVSNLETELREARAILAQRQGKQQRAEERQRQWEQRRSDMATEHQEMRVQESDLLEERQRALQDRNAALENLEHARIGQQERAIHLETVEKEWQQLRVHAREAAANAASARLLLQETRHRADMEGTRLAQIEERLAGDQARSEQLRKHRAERLSPLAQWQEDLQEQRLAQKRSEEGLREARQMLDACDSRMREQSGLLRQLTADRDAVRADLENHRVTVSEMAVHLEQFQTEMAQSGFDPDTLTRELPEKANLADWEQDVQRITNDIERLGPINLAAIDEAAECAERSTYLRQQQEDLETALATLEEAMLKIDQETRHRFQGTHEQVNEQFGETFRRLFGGGEARLQLTGDDPLHAGVAIMVRPPGKRLSTIQLMSGGEKALTAVALVFAIFSLNPAPFCLLDEVDAPLDEANVGRFCHLLEEMSSRTQFIFITHNKATMRVAEQLIGVTMQEPGVSRLVSVDITKALELAEA